jgi:hypothetical protein
MKPLNETNPELYRKFLNEEMLAAVMEKEHLKSPSYYINLISSLVTISLEGVPLNVRIPFHDPNHSAALGLEIFCRELKSSNMSDLIWEQSIYDVNVLDSTDEDKLKDTSILFFVNTPYRKMLETSEKASVN